MVQPSTNPAKALSDGAHSSTEHPANAPDNDNEQSRIDKESSSRLKRLESTGAAGQKDPETKTANPDFTLTELAPDESTQAWLNAQCEMIAGTTRGAVINCSIDAGQLQPIASWPNSHTQITPPMIDAANDAHRAQNFVVNSLNDHNDAEHETAAEKCSIASPLVPGETNGPIAVFELPDTVRRQQQAIFQLLQWGGVWFDLLRHQQQPRTTQNPLATVVDVLARNLEQRQFDSAAIVVVTELAVRLDCTRVSLGLVRKHSVSVCAISNTARVDTRSNLTREICAAMDEAVDQNATLASPRLTVGLPHVVYAQEVLARSSGNTSVLSTPLYAQNKAVGALTLEREGTKGFDQDTINTCEILAALLGPVIELKYDKERPISFKIMTSVREFVARLFGAKQTTLKLYAALLLTAMIFLAFATGEYRIVSPVRLEGNVMRAVTAPRDGFVATGLVRAGDIVETGDVLASLDNQDLQLELLKLESQREQLDKEYRAAMSSHDRSSTAILNARYKQTQAQLDLIEAQLARARLTAPLSGIVVSGDLSQSIGSPVKNGEVLFEITPLDAYRVILEIDERDIGDIAEAQRGTLTLTGLPDETLSFTVSRIVPLSTTRDGRNYFEVQAELDAPTPSIRPGMEGVGKVYVDQRKLIWVWTHKLTDWLRLTFWTWTH